MFSVLNNRKQGDNVVLFCVSPDVYKKKYITIVCCFLSVCFSLLTASCSRSLHNEGSQGEMVLYGRTSRIRGFDPVQSGDVSSAMVISKVYEGLLQYAYLARPYRVEPNLAESMPVISEDGLTYAFKIRKGIFYADDPCFKDGKGRELVASDFVYSIKRVADRKNQSTGYWAFNDRIVGLDEFRALSASEEPTDYSSDVAGLKALDGNTFQIKLKRPYPQLLWILTMQYAFAVPHEAVEYYGDEFLNHPVGTGPFVLKSWRRNYRVEFVRNPKWAQTGRVETYPKTGEPDDVANGLLDDAGKSIPFLDRIVQYVIDDQSTEWLKFVTGELDAMGYVSRDNFDAVVVDSELTPSLKEKGFKLCTAPTLDVYYIGFNMKDPVVGQDNPGEDRKKKLRQALTCAFNSKSWSKFWNNRVSRATGPIPPGVAGYVDKPSPYPFDLDKARKLLAEAGYPDGIDASTGKRLQLTIELGGADAQTRESTELTAAFMRKIGVILKPSYNNWPTFLKMMERGQCQLYRLGWIADYPDAENYLQLFYGPNKSPGPNHSNYENPEFDKLYEKVRVMSDSPERSKIYSHMADIIVEDAPWLFLHHTVNYAPYHHWMKNFKPHDFPYGMIKYRKIDTQARAQWRNTTGRKNWKK